MNCMARNKTITDEQLNVTMNINGGNEAKKKLGDLEQNYKNLKNEQEDLRKAKERLRLDGKKDSQAYKEVLADLKRNKLAMDENTNSQKEMREEIGLTGLTMGQLRKEQSRLNREVDHGVSRGTEEYERLKKELQEVNKVIKEQREDLRGTEEAMGDVGDVAEQLTGAFSDIFEGVQSGNMEQVAGGFAVIKANIAAATRAGMAFVATPFGAAMLALAGIALASREWIKYNEAAREANIITQQITNLSGEALNKARIRAKSMEETFGVEFKDNLKVARNLVTAFGISYEEAFETIEEGLIRGGQSSDEFLDSMKEYPKFFAKAGFSVQEFQQILNAGDAVGIYSDKLPDAIKEFTLSVEEQTTASRDAMINAFGEKFTNELFNNIKNGSVTSKEALSLIASEAENIGLNAQEASQLTADLFRGAGEDAGGALLIFEAVNKALDGQVEPLTALEQHLKDTAIANRELNEAQDEALKAEGYAVLSNSISLFWTKTKTLFFDGVTFVSNLFLDLLQFQTRLFAQIFAVIQSFPSIVAQSFIEIKKEILDVIGSFGKLGNVLEKLMSFDFSGAKQAAVDFKNTFKAEMGDVGDAAGEVVDKIQEIYNKTGAKVDANFAQTRAGAVAAAGLQTPNPEEDIEEEVQNRIATEQAVREKVNSVLDEWQGTKDAEKKEIASEKKIVEFETALEQLEMNEQEKNALLEELTRIHEGNIQQIRFNSHKKQQKSDEELYQNRIRLVNSSLDAAINAVGTESKLGQGLILIKQLMAAKEMAIEIGLFKSKMSLKAAEASGDIAAGTAKTASVGFPQNIPMLIAFAAQVAGIISTIKKAMKMGNSVEGVKGYEDGLYSNVTRTDGKRFRAKHGGVSGTQIVTEPTYFSNNGGFLTGEGSKPELIIDNDVFRRLDPSVIDNIMHVRHQVKGFETGMYPAQNSTALPVAPSQSDPEMKAMLAALIMRLNEPIAANIRWGYEEVEKNNELNSEVQNSRKNGNLTS